MRRRGRYPVNDRSKITHWRHEWKASVNSMNDPSINYTCYDLERAVSQPRCRLRFRRYISRHYVSSNSSALLRSLIATHFEVMKNKENKAPVKMRDVYPRLKFHVTFLHIADCIIVRGSFSLFTRLQILLFAICKKLIRSVIRGVILISA